MAEDNFPFVKEVFGQSFDQPEGGVIPEHIERANACFDALVHDMNRITDCLLNGRPADLGDLSRHVETVIELLREDERYLLGLTQAPLDCLEKKFEPIPHPMTVWHGIGSMIFTLHISISLTLPADQLTGIGLAAVLGHLGLLQKPIQSNGDPITMFKEVQSICGQLTPEILKTLSLSDSDRPCMSAATKICQFKYTIQEQSSLHDANYQHAMIINVCDVFFFLCRFRSGDKEYSPTDVLKFMRSEMRNFFHPDIIKLFFNKLSLYPLGTFVLLKSSEIAKVVGINENFLLRPIILIVLDSEREEKLPFQRVDLRRNPYLYIRGPMRDDGLTEKYLDIF